MKKKVVFISLPMSGIPIEIIEKNIEKAKEVYLAITDMDINNVAFINNLDCEGSSDYMGIDEKRMSIWYLGRAIQKMPCCDEAFFWIGWENARGCKIEYNVCKLYDIPILSVERHEEVVTT